MSLDCRGIGLLRCACGLGLLLILSGMVGIQAGDADRVGPAMDVQGLRPDAIWLESLDLRWMISSSGKPPLIGTIPGKKPMVVDGITHLHGVSTAANSFLRIDLKRSATRFLAQFATEVGWHGEKCRALIYVDGKVAYQTEANYTFNPYTAGRSAKPYPISIDLTGASDMVLAVVAEHGFTSKACFAGAQLVLDTTAKERPVTVPMVSEVPQSTGVLWLDTVNPLYIASGELGRPGLWSTPTGFPVVINDGLYSRSIVVTPKGLLCMDLKGKAKRFRSQVGIIDGSQGCARFTVTVDERLAFDGGAMRAGDALRQIDLDLGGARELTLAVTGVEAGTAANPLWAAWVGARIESDPAAGMPEAKLPDQVAMPIAEILDGPQPAIHGPRVCGASPGRPFAFSIPATGEKPLRFAVSPLPAGLTLDPLTGIISGVMPSVGTTVSRVTVSNARSEASRPLTILCGPYAMLPVPPMGWNSFNQWDLDINEARIRAAADAMVSKGFAAHGYTYVNLDEGWEGPRAADGNLTGAAGRFPDMKALGDYIHGKGLKFGIYSSPGKLCCGGRPGSYDHEQQDADLWAAWGVDYLKYDGCSGNGLPDIQQRWQLMRTCLDRTGRDIVYSTNKYRGAGAQLWRTTEDIRNTWTKLSEIGFVLQEGLEKFAGPGRFNDPDMLVVGDPQSLRRGATLTRNEQITHITLWSMLASPLLLGCDLSKADALLISLTCNDDVLDINQDPLVRQGSRLRRGPAPGIGELGSEVWTRPLFDGTVAVALFNRSTQAMPIRVTWAELGFQGNQPVRDCWRRTDLGMQTDGLEVTVEAHAAVLVRVGVPKTDAYVPK